MAPFTDAQIAVLIERIEHIAKRMDDITPLISLIAKLQRDQEHMSEDIKRLHTIAELRGSNMHAIDKRVLVLERWHRFMLLLPAAMLTIIISIGGYAKGYVSSIDDFKGDTKHRLASLEFIINGPHFERVMEPERKQTNTK